MRENALKWSFLGIFGWFCPLCLFCKNANDLGENACLCCLFAMVCPTLAFCQLRQKARQKYGIEVSRFRAKMGTFLSFTPGKIYAGNYSSAKKIEMLLG